MNINAVKGAQGGTMSGTVKATDIPNLMGAFTPLHYGFLPTLHLLLHSIRKMLVQLLPNLRRGIGKGRH